MADPVDGGADVVVGSEAGHVTLGPCSFAGCENEGVRSEMLGVRVPGLRICPEVHAKLVARRNKRVRPTCRML